MEFSSKGTFNGLHRLKKKKKLYKKSQKPRNQQSLFVFFQKSPPPKKRGKKKSHNVFKMYYCELIEKKPSYLVLLQVSYLKLMSKTKEHRLEISKSICHVPLKMVFTERPNISPYFSHKNVCRSEISECYEH